MYIPPAEIPPVAVVTGGARRIGRSIAIALAEAGFDVAVQYHGSKQDAETAAEHIRALGRRATAIPGDLSNASAPDAIVKEASERLGPVGLLVNNASSFARDELETLVPEIWENHLAVNLRAPVFLSRSFAMQLPPSAEGVIINLLDQRVWKLTPNFFSYTLSKCALWTATRTMAQALAPRIRVVGIGPGPTLASERQNLDDFKRQTLAVPLRRGAELEEIGSAVRFILSARSLTGQMIALDGGQHLAWETPDSLIPE